MKSDEEKKEGKYLIVHSEKRGAKRKATAEEFPVALNQQPDSMKKLPQEICGSVISKSSEEASLVDVSKSGVRIRCKMDLMPGQEVVLHFGIPAQEKQAPKQVSIFAKCQVIWQEKIKADDRSQVGLKILEMSKSQADFYNAFVSALPDFPQAHA
jgi:hypothetical protein